MHRVTVADDGPQAVCGVSRSMTCRIEKSWRALEKLPAARNLSLTRIVWGVPMQEFYCTKVHDFVKVSVVTLNSPGMPSSYLEGCLRAGECGIRCGDSGRFLDPNECPLNLDVFLRSPPGDARV